MPRSLVPIVLGLLLAGCSVPTQPPSGTSAPSGDPLARYAECALAYPDGRPIDCAAEFPRAEVLGTQPPAGWVCTDFARDNRGGVAYDYHYAVTGEDGLWYRTTANVDGAEGVVRIEDAGAPRTLAWSTPGQDVFLNLGTLGAGRVQLRAYHVEAEGTPESPQASLRWSAYNGTAYPILEVRSGAARYALPTALGLHLGGRETFEPQPFALDEGGVQLRVEVRPLANVAIALQDLPTGSC